MKIKSEIKKLFELLQEAKYMTALTLRAATYESQKAVMRFDDLAGTFEGLRCCYA